MTKELTVTRGILPKTSEERDMMWEEVKKYNEKNMLLNSEVNMLKKKIETLDEDILLKEGQTTILKDTIGRNKSFDPPEVLLLSDCHHLWHWAPINEKLSGKQINFAPPAAASFA
ncbi:hypothetical protein TB1_001211 [Malus domestica]